MKNFNSSFLFLFTLICIASCNSKSPTVLHETKGDKLINEIAITHVNVITMLDEKILSDQTVLIRGDKIYKIGPSNSTKTTKSATIINGQGKYLIPGLAEMHAHIPVAKNGEESLVKETMFLYLANGVTTIRGMLGDPYHLKLREQVTNGNFFAPRIYTSSPSLNGNTVPTKEEAVKKVSQYKKDAYDFLKIHPGIKWDVFEELIKTANTLGIKYSGHVPMEVGIQRAIESKYASIDHMDGYIEGMLLPNVRVDMKKNGFFGFNFANIVDEKQIADLAKATKDAGVWVVPTQSLMIRVTNGKKPEEILNEPEMKYISPDTRFMWRQRGRQFLTGNEEQGPNQTKNFIDIRKKILKALHDANVGLLLGSDSPQVFNVPGFSIHHELEAIVDAGLTPYQALQTGTINVATFFEKSKEFGTIESGKIADLVLLDANPLVDIKNANKINGTMLRGQWIAKKEIEDRLKVIAKKYSEDKN